MSVKYIKLGMWLIFAGLLTSAAWMVTPKKPSANDYIVDEKGLRATPAEKREKEPYKSVVEFKWVDKKPLPKPVNSSNEPRKPVCPYELTKIAPAEVLGATHFQLANKKTGVKAWYKEGHELYEDEGGQVQKVGEIVELMMKQEKDMVIFTVLLSYNQVEFSLELGAKSGFVPPKKSKGITLAKSLTKLDGLLNFEGRQTSANSFILNRDFFDAMIANTISEVDKLRFDINDPLKIDLMGKQSVLRKFGLKPGDRLVSFGGNKINSPEDVAKEMLKWKMKNSGAATFKIQRGQKFVSKNFKILDNAGEFKEHFEN